MRRWLYLIVLLYLLTWRPTQRVRETNVARIDKIKILPYTMPCSLAASISPNTPQSNFFTPESKKLPLIKIINTIMQLFFNCMCCLLSQYHNHSYCRAQYLNFCRGHSVLHSCWKHWTDLPI